MIARPPDFVVAGVRKAGTTWLDACLRSHPQIYLTPTTKELYYFDRHYSCGAEWYGKHFTDAPAGSRVGDVSPSYFAHTNAPMRIERDLPYSRVIILLRDPVQRAWSDFVHYWSKGDLPKEATFTTACAQIPSISDESMYGQHIARWLEHIPLDRFKVFVLEDAAADPARFVSAVYEYLEVDPGFMAPQHNDRMNLAQRPRLRRMNKAAVRAARLLHGHDLHQLVAVANKIGVRKILMAPADRTQLPVGLTSRERQELGELLAAEIDSVSNLLGRDLALTWSTHTKQKRV